MRRLGLFASLTLVLLAAAWVGSPWWATERMRKAAEERDGERVAVYVDTEALRKNVTEAVREGTLGKSPEGEEGFGRKLAAMFIGAAVDALVTPERIAAVVAEGGAPSGTEIERRRRYESPNVFVVDLHDAETKERLFTLVFHRHAGFEWKLSDLRGGD
jgi:hypothetical protein